MGLWPKKEESVCPICGCRFGTMSWAKTKDKKFICSTCNKKAKIPLAMGGSAGLTVDEIRDRISTLDENNQIRESMTITKQIGDYLKIDENQKLWYVASGKQKKTKIVYSYSDILSVELIEDGSTVTSGGLGRAVAGGVLLGGVGAIVGGSTGKKKAKNICTELRIKVTMKDMSSPAVYIDFISGGAEFKKDGIIYRTAANQAQECLALFEIMINDAKGEETKSEKSETISNITAADEIRKFKELLDEGVITQDEFDAKKKQLLGL